MKRMNREMSMLQKLDLFCCQSNSLLLTKLTFLSRSTAKVLQPRNFGFALLVQIRNIEKATLTNMHVEILQRKLKFKIIVDVCLPFTRMNHKIKGVEEVDDTRFSRISTFS
ncbi:CLUMA_CG006957, isoform A [Clunio marinus]|uniref:CLUMA_CG006957, isoform A n=1 Tax=Clunio marinus TaxID=568069 RepID=A0A1J1HZG8_9DIPT|nr:CLUMA_CG006957, isoform A [Clunio marinus]